MDLNIIEDYTPESITSLLSDLVDQVFVIN